MSNERKPDGKRAAVGFWFSIVLGVVIGIFIKRVHFGLVLGLLIGVFASRMMKR